MKKKSNWILLALFATSILLFFYHKVIFAPDEYIFSSNGDGLKNYFTYYYHIVHDSSYLNFSGMNYPYGEHFLYTDCHPALTLLFKACSKKMPFLALHCIGIF
jgi:hypothetical protein